MYNGGPRLGVVLSISVETIGSTKMLTVMAGSITETSLRPMLARAHEYTNVDLNS